MIMIKTWNNIKNLPHDISEIEYPENYLWKEINGTWYPYGKNIRYVRHLAIKNFWKTIKENYPELDFDYVTPKMVMELTISLDIMIKEYLELNT